MTTLVLFALPGLFLVLALLAGRYPGERAIHRARRATVGSRPRTTSIPIPARRRPFAAVPRGGRLVAASLASRPPPRAASFVRYFNQGGIRMNRSTLIAGAALAATALAPATAGAHVTLQPKEVPAGEYVRLNVRVPNERDDAGTRKVQVQFPAGFASASYEPVAGWDIEVKMRKAAQPIELHGETVNEEVDTVTFTGRGEAGVIPPGAFRDFGLSLRIPEKPGPLTFKALQTYQGGEVVRWIGPEDSDEPAPIVQAQAADATETAAAPTTTPAQVEADDDGDDDGDGNGLAIAALVVGGLGLATGGAALARR